MWLRLSWIAKEDIINISIDCHLNAVGGSQVIETLLLHFSTFQLVNCCNKVVAATPTSFMSCDNRVKTFLSLVLSCFQTIALLYLPYEHNIQ